MNHTINSQTHTLQLQIPGDITSTTAPSLRNELFALLEREFSSKNQAWQTLHLDLSSAKMVDSVGLNLLVSIIRLATEHSRKICCTVASRHVHRTMLFTRLDSMMQVNLLQAA